MSKLDDILKEATIRELHPYSSDKVKQQVKGLFKSMAEAWRDNEFINIDEFISEIEKL